MIVSIDTESPTPPYEQLRSQISGLIGAGEMNSGDRLPTIRQLAADLGIANGTVARTYRELEGQGLIRTKARGTVVAEVAGRSADLLAREREARLREAALAYVLTVRQLGIEPATAVEVVRHHLEPHQ